jgi:class 3 adenylate cyclase
MTWIDDLNSWISQEFNRSLVERDGRIIPTTADIAVTQTVKLDASFLYADLAGSSEIAQKCPWETTTKLIRAFLECSTRLMRAYGGEIRSFDGDRVMAVFTGDRKNTNAVKCAREIFYTVEYLLGPAATRKYKSVRENGIKLKCGIGVDSGVARAARAGIRDSNDLIWVGRAPSFAAKLSDVRDYPYSVYITESVYKLMMDDVKLSNGKNVWEPRDILFGGSKERVYRTSTTRAP